MKFVWDENKRQQNLQKHGIDFLEVSQVFTGYTITMEDTRFMYDEERFIMLGLLKHNVVVVIFVYRNEDQIRVISVRRANKYEQELYFTS